MEITEFLWRESVAADLRASTKHAAIRKLARLAAAALLLDANALADALIAREDLGSTGMGEGVAIPHARLPQIDRPYGFLARLNRPIEFDSVDGAPVDIIILLLLPQSPAGEGQLSALACAARRLRADGLLQALRRAPDASTLYAVFAGTEGRL